MQAAHVRQAARQSSEQPPSQTMPATMIAAYFAFLFVGNVGDQLANTLGGLQEASRVADTMWDDCTTCTTTCAARPANITHRTRPLIEAFMAFVPSANRPEQSILTSSGDCRLLRTSGTRARPQARRPQARRLRPRFRASPRPPDQGLIRARPLTSRRQRKGSAASPPQKHDINVRNVVHILRRAGLQAAVVRRGVASCCLTAPLSARASRCVCLSVRAPCGRGPLFYCVWL